MGGTVSAGVDNDELVDNLLEADCIKTPSVERVFRAVDRGHYFTVESKDNAYKDLAWKNGNLHISAPCIYSEVMENLKLAPGMSFLNLGSGTGYLSTMAGLILGSYGINHGVEIHEDVLNYARKKLDEFCSTSPALDEYEFCQPKFINGNCLHLGSEARQYDRVYCGAACPENHENYMKNLIKVGGILVMPINDQLMRIYRISDTNWETKSVLPVSFNNLICSNVSSNSEPLKMPDADPLSLQDICRFAVRQVLRRKIDLEHPELKKQSLRAPRKRVKKIMLPHLLIPIFGSPSDSEDNELENEDSVGMRDLERRGFLMDAHNVESCRTLLQLGQLLPRPSREQNAENGDEILDSSGTEGHSTGGDTDDEDREGKDIDTTVDIQKSHLESKEEWEEDNSVQKDKEISQSITVEDSAVRLLSRKNKIKESKREKFDSGIVEDIENGRESEDCENDISCNTEKKDSEFVKVEDSDTETAISENNSYSRIEETTSVEKASFENRDVKNYSSYMREKIKLLPLPMTLKYFVNFDREL